MDRTILKGYPEVIEAMFVARGEKVPEDLAVPHLIKAAELER